MTERQRHEIEVILSQLWDTAYSAGGSFAATLGTDDEVSQAARSQEAAIQEIGEVLAGD